MHATPSEGPSFRAAPDLGVDERRRTPTATAAREKPPAVVGANRTQHLAVAAAALFDNPKEPLLWGLI
jgi:hypothetical protein